jgi:hypothetical protein
VADLFMGKIAFDMLGGKKVEFDIQYLNPLGAPVSKGATTGGKGCTNDSFAAVNVKITPPTILLCRSFFSAPALPVAAEGITGRTSMAEVMIHEFAHISVKVDAGEPAEDYAYECNIQGGAGPLGVLSLAPGKSFFNADSYSCWARDVAISWGNASLKGDIKGIAY